MQPELTTIDIRIHPLDPNRHAESSLAERLISTFATGVHDYEIVDSYAAMTNALLENRTDACVPKGA